MPEWMLQKDNYIPEKDKDSFIDKSILSILKVLTKLRLQTDNKADKSGISAVFKLISVLLIIIFISLTRSFTCTNKFSGHRRNKAYCENGLSYSSFYPDYSYAVSFFRIWQ